MKLFVTFWSVIIFFTYYLTSAEGKKEFQLNFCFPKVHVLLLTKIVKVRRKREKQILLNYGREISTVEQLTVKDTLRSRTIQIGET